MDCLFFFFLRPLIILYLGDGKSILVKCLYCPLLGIPHSFENGNKILKWIIRVCKVVTLES